MANKTKELQFSYGIGKADRDRKVNQCITFLHKGYDVRLVFSLRGRETMHKDDLKVTVDKTIDEAQQATMCKVDKCQTSDNGFTVTLRAPKVKT